MKSYQNFKNIKKINEISNSIYTPKYFIIILQIFIAYSSICQSYQIPEYEFSNHKAEFFNLIENDKSQLYLSDTLELNNSYKYILNEIQIEKSIKSQLSSLNKYSQYPSTNYCSLNITLSSQSEVNSFKSNHPNCDTIVGSITINDSPYLGSIISLDSLNEISVIYGSLRIENNLDLTNLNGLHNLHLVSSQFTILGNNSLNTLNSLNINKVGEFLHIYYNKSLTNLSGLEQIDSINSLGIMGNDSLENLEGLDNLVYANNIHINSNPSLTSIQSLNNLTSITSVAGVNSTSGLVINNNQSLTSLNGLENLSNVSAINISNNNSLSNIIPISNINSLGSFYFNGNNNISSLAGFPDIDSITGTLEINSTTLTSLIGLDSLKYVNILNVSSNTNLTSIQGLNNVKVFNSILIRLNPSLSNLNGFQGVISINGELELNNNSNIFNLSGLSSLLKIKNLRIINNINLENLIGLNNIDSITGNVELNSNFNLTTLSGLNNLKFVSGYLRIISNQNLINLNGLSTLNTIGGEFKLMSNLSLSTLSALNTLNNVLNITIDNNPNLINLIGLEGLDTVYNLKIINNNNLVNLNGLNNITYLQSLTIDNNSSLNSFSGLQNVTVIYGSLFIRSNNYLNNLSGFSNLNAIIGSLNISNNANLSSFNGLNSLSSIGGLRIEANQKLIDISSLSSMNIATPGVLQIFNNINLSNCHIVSICNFLENYSGYIYNNNQGCLSENEVESNCNSPCFFSTISIPLLNQIANPCSQRTFSINHTGTPPFQYQWYKNGIPIPNTNSSSYTTPQLTTFDNGNIYNCIVSNCNGTYSDTSSTATLTVVGPCITENPYITINKSILVPNQILNVEGSNFTPFGSLVFKISHQSEPEFGSNYPQTINANGHFSYSMNINSSFPDGSYSISAIDVSTGKSVTKTFIINNFQNIYLEISSPIATDIIKEDMDVLIEWKDFEESTTTSGQSAYVQKEYKIETSNDGGTTWKLLKKLKLSVKVNAYDRFVYFGKINFPGTYQIKITDIENPTNFDISDGFVVTGCSGGGFKPSLEWDATVPSEHTKNNPKGLAADGTARILVKLTKQNTNIKTVKNINATISSIGNTLTGTQYLGKIKLCTDHINYNEEANNATSTSILYPAKGKGNESQYWFWLVAPDDFASSLDYTGSEREIMVSFNISYIDNTAETIELCEPVKIVRPALVFAHGFLGNPSSFYYSKYKMANGEVAYFNSSQEWKFVKYLDLYEFGSFQQNASLLLADNDNLIVENSIKESLLKMHKSGYANKRIDYIGHSMGGCVARYAIVGGNSLYKPGIGIFKNYQKGYINKFITINTPHNGSFIADYFIDFLTTPLANIDDWLKTIKEFGFDSESIINLRADGNGINFPLTTIKNHLLSSDLDKNNIFNNNLLISHFNEFSQAFKSFNSISDIGGYIYQEFENNQYFQNSDGIVDLSSQLAGKSFFNAINIDNGQMNAGNTSLITGLDKFHVGIQSDIKVGTRLKFLLNAGINSGFFDESIPANPIINNANSNNPSLSRLLTTSDTTLVYDTNYIKIINPLISDTVYVDSLLNTTILVKDTVGLKKIIILFQGNIDVSTAKDSLQYFNSIITSNYLSNQNIVAIAEYDSTGNVRFHLDTIKLTVINNDTLSGFYAEPSSININPGEEFLPTFHPEFSSSIGEIEITNDSLTFAIADTNVVSYNDSLFFVAIDTGSTYIVFDYLGFKDTIYAYLTNIKNVNNKITICSNDTISLYAGLNDTLSQYQWQINTGDGFQDISASINYIGCDSSTIQILEINPANNKNLFRCLISDTLTSYSSEVFEINIGNTWLGVIDTAWENPMNWSCNLIPDNNTNVLIPDFTPYKPVINSFALCKSLKNKQSSSLIINEGFKLCIGELNMKCPSDTVLVIYEPDTGSIYNYPILNYDNACIDSVAQNQGLGSGSIFPIGTTTNCFSFFNQGNELISSCCFNISVEQVDIICNGGTFTNQSQIDEFIIDNPLCEHIDGSIVINGYNSNISNFYGFSNIKSISEGLSIVNCPLINNFEGFDSLQTVGALNLGNLNVNNLYGFSQLTTISQALSLQTLPFLTSLSEFDSLTALGSLNIFSTNGLTTLNGLENISNPLSSVYIQSNFSLNSLIGLNNIPEITSSLNISYNPNLLNFEGLNSLQKCSQVYISQNNRLSNLSGLNNLDTISYNLSIQGNDSLTSILDLSSLAFIGTGLNNRISNNPLLSTCNIPYFCSIFLNPNLNFVIENNATGCETIAEIQTSCGISVTCPGNITFNSQSDVDSFPSIYGICPDISGDVNISISNITNLDSLYGIQRIQGNLNITNNPVLSDLSGLSSLKSVLGTLNMYANDSITNLNGLSEIDTLGALNVVYNPLLTSICGLDSLVVLNSIDINSNPLLDSLCYDFILNNQLLGSLTIAGNDSLKNLKGLDSLSFIDGDVLIIYNNQLINTEGLNQLKVVKGSLNISDNQNLTNIQLNSIEKIAKESNNPDYKGFYITNNPNLVTISLFPKLDSIFYELAILGNQKLEHINGFNSLHFIETNLIILGSDSLQLIENFDSLQSIGNYIEITSNPLLESINLFSTLLNFQGVITLTYNPKLTQIVGELESDAISGLYLDGNNSIDNLNFLTNVKSITSDMFISDCDSLINLAGLDSLSFVGSLYISNNDKLQTLSSLSTLDSITFNIYIINNDSLENLNGLENVTTLQYGLEISDNFVLSDISDLHQLDLSALIFINISNNSVLSTCDIESICNYLTLPINQVTISNNAAGCNSEIEVQNACNN